MQAVLALCYFCENHGPRVVMACQPLRATHNKINNSASSSNSTTNSDNQPEIYGDSDLQNEIVDDEIRCAACSSFGNGMGIVSNDHEAQTSYVSTQVPINERVYQIVRQTCVRSLSVEISTPLFNDNLKQDEPSHSHDSKPPRKNSNGDLYKEGAVLYGDQDNGYTLSYTFKLRDAKARGFHRSYSLVVVSMDHYMLLNNYDYFLNGFQAIISRLQEMALGVFAMEQDHGGDLATAVNRMVFMPAAFFSNKLSLDTSRSLTTIVNNNDVYHILHRQMLYLLRTQVALLKDTVLEGVPTQDMLVMMEREPHQLFENDVITSFATEQTLDHITNLRYLVRKLIDINRNVLVFLVWTVVVGDQVIVKSNDPMTRKLFLFAFAHLLPIGCVKINANANEYIDHYKSNFVGSTLTLQVPEEEKPSTFVINVEERSGHGVDDLMDKLTITVENIPPRTGPLPKIVDRYVKALSDVDLSEDVLLSILNCTRNEYLNYAKLIFQLSRQQEKIDLDQVLKIIGCDQQDSPVLLFFQSGLSQRYKQAVLMTIDSSRPRRS